MTAATINGFGEALPLRPRRGRRSVPDQSRADRAEAAERAKAAKAMKRPQDLGEPGCTANDPLVFAAAFNSGDPAAVEQLYEDLGILVPEPGQPVSGRDRAAANTALLELGLPIEVRPRHIYTVDDIALLIVDWSVTGTGRDGTPVHISGTATDVAASAWMEPGVTSSTIPSARPDQPLATGI